MRLQSQRKKSLILQPRLNFFCGLFSGVFTGFGVGGGLFLIMLLGWVSDFSQLELQSINLIFYIPTAIFSVWVYSKEKSVDFKIGLKFIIFAGIMAILGAYLAHRMDVNLLRKLFAIYLISIGIFFLIPRKRNNQ